MTRVLVAGDANLDLVLRGDVRPRFGQAEQLLDDADLVLGSSAGITAGLSRLGLRTDLVARVGDDLFGAHVRSLLAEAGVGTGHVRPTDSPTGMSVILADAEDRAILTLAGAMAELTADDIVDALTATGAAHLHVASFFLLPGIREALPAVLSQARAAGITTSLDTNWDPRQEWDGVAACLPFVDVLLPNAAEAGALAAAVGAPRGDAVAAARTLAAHGPIVAVKDGAAGGFVVAGDDVVRGSGMPVDVVDTTGAGDSFNAAFLGAWLERRPLGECVRRAAIGGSLSTRAAGGTRAQATRAEIDAVTEGTPSGGSAR